MAEKGNGRPVGIRSDAYPHTAAGTAAARRRYFKTQARHTLYRRGNWMTLIGGGFLLTVLTVGLFCVTVGLFSPLDLSFLAPYFGASAGRTVGYCLFWVLLLLIVFPVAVGLCNLCSDMVRFSGASGGVGDLFESFGSTKALMRCYRILFSWLWRAALLVLFFFAGFTASDLLYRRLCAAGLFTHGMIVMIAGYLIVTAIGIGAVIRLMRTFLVAYIAFCRPELSVRDAVRASAYAMRGHKIESLTLIGSFILWFLLSLLTFGILLYLIFLPYLLLTVAAFSGDVYGASRAAIENGQYKYHGKMSIGTILTDNLDESFQEGDESHEQ